MRPIAGCCLVFALIFTGCNKEKKVTQNNTNDPPPKISIEGSPTKGETTKPIGTPAKSSGTTPITSEPTTKPKEKIVPKKVTVETLATAKADASLTAEEWGAEFQKDSKAAIQKYEGRVVEVKGTVSEIFLTPQKNQIRTKLKIGESGAVDCFVQDDVPWEKIMPGSEVTLKGIFPQYVFSPTLMPAVWVSTDKESPSKPLACEELVKAYKKDPKKAAEDFEKQKSILVSGEVTKAPKSRPGNILFEAKGADGQPVDCLGDNDLSKELMKLKVGSKFKALVGVRKYGDNPVTLSILAIKID